MYGSKRPSPPGSTDGRYGQVPGPPRLRLRLSDGTIVDIAEQIARAMSLAPPDDQTTWILARAAGLPAEDEERVIRARSRFSQRTGDAPQGRGQ